MGVGREIGLPHFFDVIEFAHFGAEDVDDDVTGIHQHPIAIWQAFDPRLAVAGLAQGGDHLVGHGADMALRTA